MCHDRNSIFDVADNARQLINGIEEHFSQADAVAHDAGSDTPPVSVLWLDGWDDKTPFVEACCGSFQTIVDKARAKHIFHDQGIEEVKTWDSVSWDVIAERDPDLIVLVDASWDLAGKFCSLLKQMIVLNFRISSHPACLVLIFQMKRSSSSAPMTTPVHSVLFRIGRFSLCPFFRVL
jgi:hypothetical protein